MGNKQKKLLFHSFLYIALALGAVTMLIPFFWMVATSLKEPGDIFAVHGSFWKQFIPDPLVWDNFGKAWDAVPFGRYYMNTIIVTVAVTAGQVMTCALAAFAFARLTFPGRDKIFFGYLATMMIPFAVTMIPNFVLMSWMGELSDKLFPGGIYFMGYYVGKLFGLDSYFALIAPAMFSAYGTFMLRQFFMGLPSELEEAARIDGSSVWGIFWNIAVPLSKAALATLTTLTFMGTWKDFMWPLTVINNDAMKTLPVGLASFQGLYTTEWTLLMAGSLIMLIPIILVFIFNQRYIVEGIKLQGIKG
jgi:multiple sugar transport system permease protein